MYNVLASSHFPPFSFFYWYYQIKNTWCLVQSSAPSSLFSETCQQITFSTLWQIKMYCLIGFLSPTAAALGKKKWWNSHVTMVTCFFLYIFLLEDERPHGEDYPGWLHHDLQPDPNWDNPPPEAHQTCGPREADGLYVHGRPRTQWLDICKTALKPSDLHLLFGVY